jgi:hypothetical protein
MKKLLSILLALASILVLKATAQESSAVVAMQESYVELGGTILVPFIVNSGTTSIKTIRGGITYDPANFSFAGLTLGPSIADNSPAAILDLDTTQIASGILGFQLMIPGSAPGLPPAKLNYFAILKLQDKHTGADESSIEFTDNPYPKEVRDASGNLLTSLFVNGTVGVRTTNETRKIILSSKTIQAGSLDAIPISIQAKGNENSIGLSLAFDQSRFTFVSATSGTGAPGATVLVNQGLNAGGLVGLSLVLSPGQALQPGLQQIFQVRFRAKSWRAYAGSQYFFAFGTFPTDAEVVTATMETIRESFDVSQILLVDGVEGDVAPRPYGNQATTLSDWVQVGRFAAALDTVSDSFEFQKADCAPKSTRGDGVIGLSDWVQTGRYAAGLDQFTSLGGPIGPNQFTPEQEVTGLRQTSRIAGLRLPDQARRVLLTPISTEPEERLYAVTLHGRGDENGLAFSIEFDAEVMKFESGIATNSEAIMFVNTSQVGRIGVAILLRPGQAFGLGENQVLVLKFRNRGPKVAEVSFVDAPVRGEAVNTMAEVLPAVFATEAASPIKRNLRGPR